MIAVACAIIEHQNKILVTQRGFHKSEGGLWEFPGGKLEAEETPQSCIVREISEELDLQIAPYEQLNAAEYAYPQKVIRLIPLVCHLVGGELTLREHAQFQWITADELPALSWCPADVAVVQTYLQWRASS